ncbi:MAG: site-specific integrase [Phycisphaerae bacterium]|nr:site-specific integrase [Phycisphaerae bacterium]
MFADIEAQACDILLWCKMHFKDRLEVEPFADLMTENHYKVMMADFARGGWDKEKRKKAMGPSQMNKRRQRFWNIIRFARSAEMALLLPFKAEDVQGSCGGNDLGRNRQFPTVEELKTLLRAADPKMKLWMVMAMGLGFTSDDIARACPENLGIDKFDQARWKTRRLFPRGGGMPPLVWTLLQRYLRDNPRERGELLFRTRLGNPIVSIRNKTPDEMKAAAESGRLVVNSYTRSDSLQQAFYKLQRKTGVTVKGGFSTFRTLAATALASSPGVSGNEVRTFLGQGNTDAVDIYIKKLTPQTHEVVTWVNQVLDSTDVESLW